MIELPLFDTFKKEEIATFPEINNPSAVTISEIKTAYPQLGKTLVDAEEDIFEVNKWVEGNQEANVEREIISRTYAELEFEADAHDFDFITGGDAQEFGSDKYWRVIHRFTEIEYFSNNSTELQNFRIWEKSYHKWQQEIIYLHQEIGALTWNRPKISVPVTSTTTGTGNNAVTTLSCPAGALPSAPTGETGASLVFGELNQNDELECYRWASIPLNFVVTFYVGEALGGFVETDGSGYTIIASRTSVSADNNGNLIFGAGSTFYQQVSNGSPNNPIKYKYPYISVVWGTTLNANDATRTAPTFVRLRRYGVENFRVSLPYERDTEPEILHHNVDTPYIAHTNNTTTATRYKPPNRYDFPDDFWNDNTADPLIGFGSRLGSGGSTTTND